MTAEEISNDDMDWFDMENDSEYQDVDVLLVEEERKHENAIYNKAIDDMVNTLIRNSTTEEIDGKICLIVTDKRIKLIAEQLKKGAYNE